MTRILRVDGQAPSSEALERAAAVLKRGGLVAFPTESFYGLGADALEPRALARVFAVKGRPETKPLLVLVDSIAMAEGLVSEVPAEARALMARWPAALTLVLKAAPRVPEQLHAGTGTIGVRIPAHPVALGLVRAAGMAVTAPSANPSGAEPPTTAGAVAGYFADALELILDGGPTAGGAASTLVDCTVRPLRVLRHGPVAV